MGIDSDGILAFGVDLGEEPDLPWRVYDEEEGDYTADFEEWYCNLHGVSNKTLWAAYYEWAETPEGQAVLGHQRVQAYEDANPEWRDSLNDHYTERKSLLKNVPIEIVTHCSWDYPMYIVAVEGSVTKAYRGGPQKIEDWVVPHGKVQTASDFCDEHGIPFEDPTWILASIYG